MIWWAQPVSKLASGRAAEPGAVFHEGGVPHISCREGFLRLERVQPPGADEMDAKDAAAKGHLPEGMKFQ